MILVHNYLLRGINSIYNQCEKVQQSSSADIADFVNYAMIWAQVVDEHHNIEEQTLFPDIEQMVEVPGLLSANIEQHKTFHNGLEEYKEYLGNIKLANDSFDSKKLRAIIDSFLPVLRQHLADEIQTLLGLGKYEDKLDWNKWFKEFQDKIMKNSGGDGHLVRLLLPTPAHSLLERPKVKGQRSNPPLLFLLPLSRICRHPANFDTMA